MKKIFTIALSLAALAIISTGCTKNELGTWDTLVNMSFTASIPEENVTDIKNCIGEVEYFNQPHVYDGYHDECLGKAVGEFLDAAELVDGNRIIGNLHPGESVTLTLIFRSKGAAEGEIAQQVYWAIKTD